MLPCGCGGIRGVTPKAAAAEPGAGAAAAAEPPLLAPPPPAVEWARRKVDMAGCWEKPVPVQKILQNKFQILEQM